MRQHAGTTVELIVAGCLNGFSDEDIDFLSTMSLRADRPVNWNVLGVSAMNPDAAWSQLAAGTAAAARGATVMALTLPHTMQLRLSFEHGAILDGLPGWREVFALPPSERMAALSDPATRRRLDAGAQSDEAGILRHLAVWDRLIFDETFAPENAAAEGRSVGEVARERGVEPFDALLDVVVADELRTGLRPPIGESEADWELRAQVWQDPRAIVGGSDAGAHLDTMCGAIYSTSMLGDGVRARGLLSWERAVQLLSDVPARLYGLRDRGRLAPGGYGDVVVFDPDAIGHGPVRTRDDLPGGASRLYAEAVGVRHVLVNGTEIVREGDFTDARARAGCCVRAAIPIPCTPTPTGPDRRRSDPRVRGRPRADNAATMQALPILTGDVDIELITDVDRLLAYVDGWEALADSAREPRSGGGAVAAWAAHMMHPDSELHVWIATDGTEIVGALPFVAERMAKGKLRLTPPATDMMYGIIPIARPDRAAEVAEAVAADVAARAETLNLATIYWLPGGSPWMSALAARFMEPEWVTTGTVQYSSYCADLTPGFEEWFAQRNGEFRRTVGRRRRRSEEQGFRIFTTEDAEEIIERLPRLQPLYQLRKESRGGAGYQFDESMIAAIGAALHLSPRGRFRLSAIEREDVVIGASLTVRAGSRMSAWLTGFDPEWSRLGPGITALLEALDAGSARWMHHRGPGRRRSFVQGRLPRRGRHAPPRVGHLVPAAAWPVCSRWRRRRAPLNPDARGARSSQRDPGRTQR